MDEMATQGIGGRLRRARVDRGLSLDDAADVTKLSIEILRAIERNEFDRLPPGMYRKAYLRTLAAVVGLDPDEIAAEYARLFEPPDEAPIRRAPNSLTTN